MDHSQFVMGQIMDVDELLHYAYGCPDHNNKQDPLDELVFILLSRRTRDLSYERVYNRLKERFPHWEDLASASTAEVLRIIEEAGLGPKRASEIQANLKTIRDTLGSYSLDRLRGWNNSRIFKFLTSLRGVGPKSAYCVMMYSLGRRVFPVDTHVSRVSQRLGLIPSGTDHKEAQEKLKEAFPERIRYSLHVNMLAHGKAVCQPRRPDCESCMIAGYCSWKRETDRHDAGPGFLDLFSGAGGMSLGFERAGFTLKTAIDSSRWACRTFLFNRTHLEARRVLNQDIEAVGAWKFRGRGIKVIVAGPPCQEFSKVRKNGFGELGRNELYKEVLRFASVVRPRFVVIENVPGMATHLNQEYVDRVERGLRDQGYAVRSEMVNAKDYWIPQNRIRLFFVARRILRGSSEAARASLERVWSGVRAAKSDLRLGFLQGISGLPRLKPGEGGDLMRNNRRGARSLYARSLGCNGGTVYNHIARQHNPRDLTAYRLMDEGDNARDLHRKNPELMPYSTENFPTKFFKIRGSKPSPTILAHLRKDANSFIHSLDDRGITPREAARLQSFPDSYRFLGTFGLQFEQIGNAVPPLLAEVFARAILAELNPYKKQEPMV